MDLEYEAHELYNDEMNWNNCDKSSGQCVETYDEIFERLRGGQ